eukprot:1722118-Amphidinium_carterae.1
MIHIFPPILLKECPAGQNYFKQSNTYLHIIADKIFEMTLEMYREPVPTPCCHGSTEEPLSQQHLKSDANIKKWLHVVEMRNL